MGELVGRTLPLKGPGVPDRTIAERLERGEVIEYPKCPFPIPNGDDLTFLLEQRLGKGPHKNISYNPHTDKTSGYRYRSTGQAERLHQLLSDFSCVATRWLTGVLPFYAERWHSDLASFRPEEEATRKLRQTARNDLLHVDAFPSRPTNGWRILRFFVNVNPNEPRVWVTSDNFARLLKQFGKEVGLPASNEVTWGSWLRHEVLRLFHPNRKPRSTYDEFMLRFHNFLKANDEFQERCFKRFWSFQPGSAWMVMTDAASHAVLRGRYAFEQSFFVAPESLALPSESPAALLACDCGFPVLSRAA